MKKAIALALSLVMALGLAACKGNTDGSAASSSAASGAVSAPVEPVQVTLVTGDIAGTYYAVGGTMRDVLNEKLTLCELSVESTGGSKANINLITDGEAEMAILQSDVISYAHNGTNAFSETGVEDNALWVAGLYDETVQIVAAEGITDVTQLAGKTVCLGDIGSGTRVIAEQILAAYDMTIDDVDAVYDSFQDSMEALAQGKIDAAFTVAGAPTTAITDLAATNEFSMISLTDDALAYIAANFPFLVQDNLPAGTYDGIEQEIKCVAVQGALVAADTVSGEVVYELLKTMFDNKAELEAAQPKFQFLDITDAVSTASVALHPGAEKFYKEAGVLK